MSNRVDQEVGPGEIIARFELCNGASVTSRSLFDYADALRQVGRRQEALSIYAQLESSSVPESKLSLVALFKGQTLYDIGQFSEAEHAFRAACARDTSTVPRVYLAVSLAAQELFQEAVDALSDGLLCQGDVDEVWLNMALNQRALGRLKDSLSSLQQALAISPEYSEALAVLNDVRAAISISCPDHIVS